jgi:hypothetical protein
VIGVTVPRRPDAAEWVQAGRRRRGAICLDNAATSHSKPVPTADAGDGDGSAYVRIWRPPGEAPR